MTEHGTILQQVLLEIIAPGPGEVKTDGTVDLSSVARDHVLTQPYAPWVYF